MNKGVLILEKVFENKAYDVVFAPFLNDEGFETCNLRVFDKWNNEIFYCLLTADELSEIKNI